MLRYLGQMHDAQCCGNPYDNTSRISQLGVLHNGSNSVLIGYIMRITGVCIATLVSIAHGSTIENPFAGLAQDTEFKKADRNSKQNASTDSIASTETNSSTETTTPGLSSNLRQEKKPADWPYWE